MGRKADGRSACCFACRVNPAATRLDLDWTSGGGSMLPQVGRPVHRAERDAAAVNLQLDVRPAPALSILVHKSIVHLLIGGFLLSPMGCCLQRELLDGQASSALAL